MKVFLAYDGEYENECCIGAYASLELLIAAYPGTKRRPWSWFENSEAIWLDGPVRVEVHDVVVDGPLQSPPSVVQSMRGRGWTERPVVDGDLAGWR